MNYVCCLAPTCHCVDTCHARLVDISAPTPTRRHQCVRERGHAPNRVTTTGKALLGRFSGKSAVDERHHTGPRIAHNPETVRLWRSQYTFLHALDTSVRHRVGDDAARKPSSPLYASVITNWSGRFTRCDSNGAMVPRYRPRTPSVPQMCATAPRAAVFKSTWYT